MGPHALRRRLQLLGSASLALSICGITLSALAQSTELVSTRAVPTYFSDSENWAKAKAQAGGLRYVVMNPDSGPGAAIDPGWVSRLVDIGIEPKVLGYVATTYAARPLVDVVADIEKYRQWYGVTSIFLDETPWGCSQVAYYQSLATTVHANGGILVMNPGGLPLNCMVDIPDIVVSFENNMQAYLSSTAPNPTGYQPQKFWHLIYGAPVGRHREIEELARQRGAGFIYVTSDDLPNPWDGIETFPALPITAPTVVPFDVTTTTTPSTSSTTTPSATTTTTTTTTTTPTTTTTTIDPAPPRTAVPLPPASGPPTTIARSGASSSQSSSTIAQGRATVPS